MLSRAVIIQELKNWYIRTYGEQSNIEAFLSELSSYNTKQLDRLLDKKLEEEGQE